MRRILLSVAFMLALSGVAYGQDSEFSGGGGGGITTAGGSGTAGVIPAFVSGTSLEDSKMTTSGTNKGTWTLYDDTAVTGNTSLVIRHGAGQSANPFEIRNAAGTLTSYFAYSFNTLYVGSMSITGDTGTITTAVNSDYRAPFFGDFTISNPTLRWPDDTPDVGIKWSAPGILAVTDGSTGQGGIGIADSAINTVSDALILRHQGGTVAGNGFGTGLVWEGENDGGVMHPMASIDAVYDSDDNGSETTRLDFRTYLSGTETAPTMSLVYATNQAILSAPNNFTVKSLSGYAEVYAGGANPIYLSTNATPRWSVLSTGHFEPYATNTYDIGTSSAFVRNNYVSTSIQGVRAEVIPSDNVAENFAVITAATSDAVTNGYIEYTVTAVDTTNHIIQTETGMVPFVAVNENGTVTASFGTAYGVHQDNAGGGALVVSFGTSVATTNVTLSVTSNYDEATLTGTVVNTFRYRVVLTSGTATVTPDT